MPNSPDNITRKERKDLSQELSKLTIRARVAYLKAGDELRLVVNLAVLLVQLLVEKISLFVKSGSFFIRNLT